MAWQGLPPTSCASWKRVPVREAVIWTSVARQEERIANNATSPNNHWSHARPTALLASERAAWKRERAQLERAGQDLQEQLHATEAELASLRAKTEKYGVPMVSIGRRQVTG